MDKKPVKKDVIIIGAGPLGLNCGVEAVKRNKSHLILEAGCLTNSIYNYPVNMTFFSTSENLEIGGVPFVSISDKPTRSEALEYYRRVKELWKLDVHVYERTLNIKESKDPSARFVVETSKGQYLCDYAIIAIGFFDKPNLLNVPGEDLPKVKHYYDEPHPYAFQNVLIIGGGNSAADAALETYRKGAKVTMVIREDGLKDSVKYWIKPNVENRIKAGEIKAYFHSTIKEIKEKEVYIQTPDGCISVENDFVLALTGFHTDFSLLERCGIKLSGDKFKKPFYNENTYETNVPGLFLSGVVCSGLDTTGWFIENSRLHAAKTFDRIAEYERR
ncbi:MAG TPA: YpdA family putative bacillithiol disulfide reductase [Ignavibacteriales bacterium]|nr:YpdA family putative bacillithiol disulfide reductase [Ignavibacteriales bacterium]